MVAHIPHPDSEEKGGRRGNEAVFVLVYLSRAHCLPAAASLLLKYSISPLAAAVLTFIMPDSVTEAHWHLSVKFILEIDHVRNLS